MSKLPRFGGPRPQLNTTTQSTSKDPRTGALRTITRTNVTELRPCAATAACEPCDVSAGPSGMSASRVPPPSALPSMMGRPQMGMPRPPAGIARFQAGLPQRRMMPQPIAESTRIGAGLSSSTREFVPCDKRTPAIPGPRGAVESKRPKELKSRGIPKPDTSRPKKGRAAPQDQSAMNQTATADQILNLTSPDVAAVEQHVQQDLLERYSIKRSKVYSKGKNVHDVPEGFLQTPAGIEPVLQQMYTEKRVERNADQERVVKNVSVTQFGTRVTISEQQIDPDYGLPGRQGRDVVTIKETVAVTPSYKATAKDVSHESGKGKVTIDPEDLADLVAEENEDVENTLRMAPPDLTLNPEKYTMKKRLQKLRLNTESMVLLQQSLVNPASTADDAMLDTPPEALVNIMHTIEAGVAPQCAPDQIFNTLFEERGPQHSVQLSSIGPGPLQDVVVPQELTKDIHKEAMTADLNRLTEKMKNAPNVEEIPYIDIFTRLMDEEGQKSIKKVPATNKPFKPIGEEKMPWGHEDIEPMVNIVGAEPVEVLNAINIEDLEQSGKMQEELATGIEYFVDADPVQYMSRVQLRGSHPPSWFPGYIYALPEFKDIVKIARSPDEVFYASWKSVQPRIIPDGDISILP